MVSKWTFLIFGFLFHVSVADKNELKSIIDWSALEYEDSCIQIANSTWDFFKNPTKQTLHLWEEALFENNYVKEHEKNVTAELKNENRHNFHTQMKLLQKPGDAIINKENWRNFSHFVATAELMRSKLEISGKSSREVAENVLSRSGEANEKLDVWSSWHNHLAPLQTNFSKILPLVNEAAQINEETNAQTYWEMLSAYPDGYEDLKSYWDEISSLHKSLVNLVSDRLSAKYKISLNKAVPAHLLGSLQGNDWTNLAADIIPHTDQIFRIKGTLWKKNLFGEKLYKVASQLGVSMLKISPEANFWEHSEFNRTCPTRIVNFCREGKMRVFTCYEASLSNYITAHKNVGKILFNQLASRSSNPIFEISNRFSVLEESFAEYFGLMSMSPIWLQTIGLVEKETWESNEELAENLRIVSMLNVLPRLAYYVSADFWRLKVLKENITDTKELALSWWKHRLEYENITTNQEEIPSFLDDEFITSNKPYLSKFVGTLLAFQLYNQFHSGLELKFTPISVNHLFAKIAVNSSQENWLESLINLTENEIDEVSTYSLTSYFSFFENFLKEQGNINFPLPITKQSDFEKQETEYREKIHAPTTTTTTTTTTTSTTTTTAKTITKKGKKAASLKISAEPEIPPTEATKAKIYNLEILDDTEKKDENKPKPTNKAVYAVGAVLVATILVCIIAIFGRRRCTKTPKNRRYV